jgi:hypothetical protein
VLGSAARGIITKRGVLDMLMELRRRNPRAAAPRSDLAVDPHKADVLVSVGTQNPPALNGPGEGDRRRWP